MHVWSFWAEYWPIWSIWCYAKPIKQCERGASLVSWYVYTRTFAPSKVIMMFGPKTAIFAPKYAFFGTYRPCWLIWYPAGWLVGSCGAGAVSRKTPIHFLGPRGALYYLWLTRPQWKIWIPCIKAGMPHELSEEGGGVQNSSTLLRSEERYKRRWSQNLILVKISCRFWSKNRRDRGYASIAYITIYCFC